MILVCKPNKSACKLRPKNERLFTNSCMNPSESTKIENKNGKQSIDTYIMMPKASIVNYSSKKPPLRWPLVPSDYNKKSSRKLSNDTQDLNLAGRSESKASNYTMANPKRQSEIIHRPNFSPKKNVKKQYKVWVIIFLFIFVFRRSIIIENRLILNTLWKLLRSCITELALMANPWLLLSCNAAQLEFHILKWSKFLYFHLG